MEIMNIGGIECYEKDGVAYLELETCSMGLGFTKTDVKVSESGFRKEYLRIDWPRVRKYLSDLKFIDTSVDSNNLPDFIPENIFYRLAMKAKNEVAEAFQAKIADEVIPSIRKTGGYIAGQSEMSADELMAKALLVAQKTLAEREARISALTVENQILLPKAEYFDELVDRNLLTNFRETAKQLHIKQGDFIQFLLDKKYLYRDKRGKLLPYADKNDGLFEVKECFNDKTQWSGTQTLVTPKGRETFRLLCLQAS